MRLPEVLDEKPKAWLTRSRVHEEEGSLGSGEEPELKSSRADRGQPELERLQGQIADLRARIAEVEAGIQADAKAVPEAAMRRHLMREAERARITAQIEEVHRRLAASNATLESLAVARAAEEEECQAACEALQAQVEPLRTALGVEEAEAASLRWEAGQRERQAIAEEAEIAKLQAHMENLRGEITAAEARRSRAEAEAEVKRRLYCWGLLCGLVLAQDHHAAMQAATEEFEALALESEEALRLEQDKDLQLTHGP